MGPKSTMAKAAHTCIHILSFPLVSPLPPYLSLSLSSLPPSLTQAGHIRTQLSSI